MPRRRFLAALLSLSLTMTAFSAALGGTAHAEPSLPALVVEENLVAPSAILVDFGTGEILVEKHADDRRAIASVTKVMTMLLALEAVDSGKVSLDDEVSISGNAMGHGGSQIYLEAGERLKLGDLLLSIATESANDSAVAVGEFIAGSEESFVGMMNQRAAELGMANTHFENPHGLTSPGAYSSAHDVAVMSRELLKHETIYKWTTVELTYLQRPKVRSMLVNTNRGFLRSYQGADGLKTGWTNAAGYCLSATAKRNDLRLVAVVLGAPSLGQRLGDVTRLLDYGFANYTGRVFHQAGTVVGTISVDKGRPEQAPVVAVENLAVLAPKGTDLDALKVNVKPLPLTAPVPPGATVGEAELVDTEGKVYAKVAVKTVEGVPKAGFFELFRRVLPHILVK
jgi:D-alanyl-D-alanine carboxypeptidase (penicillin-binding protein 5/6)